MTGVKEGELDFEQLLTEQPDDYVNDEQAALELFTVMRAVHEDNAKVALSLTELYYSRRDKAPELDEIIASYTQVVESISELSPLQRILEESI